MLGGDLVWDEFMRHAWGKRGLGAWRKRGGGMKLCDMLGGNMGDEIMGQKCLVETWGGMKL